MYKSYPIHIDNPTLIKKAKYIKRFLEHGELPEIGFTNPNCHPDKEHVFPDDLFANVYYEIPDESTLVKNLKESEQSFLATISVDKKDRDRLQLTGLPIDIQRELGFEMTLASHTRKADKSAREFLERIENNGGI